MKGRPGAEIPPAVQVPEITFPFPGVMVNHRKGSKKKTAGTQKKPFFYVYENSLFDRVLFNSRLVISFEDRQTFPKYIVPVSISSSPSLYTCFRIPCANGCHQLTVPVLRRLCWAPIHYMSTKKMPSKMIPGDLLYSTLFPILNKMDPPLHCKRYRISFSNHYLTVKISLYN